MVRLTLNRGKSHGLRPNELVRTIAHHADIPGSAIGRIDIYKKYTLVDVPDKYVDQVVGNADKYRIRKQPVSLHRS
jgi:ATP-dependent RNA helicase DeaD